MKQNIYEIRVKKVGSEEGTVYQIPSENSKEAIAEAMAIYTTTLMDNVEAKVLSVSSNNIKQDDL